MIFGLFKDKVAENVASEINNTHKKLYSLSKKDDIGMHTIDKKIFQKEFGDKSLKFKKDFVSWESNIGDVTFDFVTEPKNKNEIYVSLQGKCLSPDCVISIMCFDKKDKNVICVNGSRNSRGMAIRDELVKKFGFKDRTT